MKLEHIDIIDAPMDKVYLLVRDHLSEIAEHLPNVAEIKVVERNDDDKDTTHIVNQWFAQASLPPMAKKFVSEELFSWNDTATWDNQKHCVSYELESTFAKDIYDATGVNYFSDKGDGRTELRLTCQVDIYPDKIPGVPRLLAKKVQPMIEQLIEKMLAPNLTSLGEGIRKYLEANESA